MIPNDLAAAPTDPLLVERARAELKQIRRIQEGLARRVAVVPLLAEEPSGPGRLRQVINHRAAVAY